MKRMKCNRCIHYKVCLGYRNIDIDGDSNSCPYSEERPQGELISREALKRDLEVTQYNDIDDLTRTERLIDNATAVDTKPFATVTFDKDELDRIVDERVIKPIKNGELVIKKERPHEWIPVRERLPEEETNVLVCNANGDVTVSKGSYSTEIKDEFIWYTSGWRFGKVIAWMSLPEPYKEADDEC